MLLSIDPAKAKNIDMAPARIVVAMNLVAEGRCNLARRYLAWMTEQSGFPCDQSVLEAEQEMEQEVLPLMGNLRPKEVT